jgi:membrane fusion protein (multidrug efflux system)
MTARVLACAALVLAVVASGCDGNPESVGAAPEEPTVEPRVPVRTTTVEPAVFEQRLEVTGNLEPWDEVHISTELGGFVREVSFEKGDTIVANQVLARIGDDLAESRLRQARADLADAEAVFEKTEKLFEREAVPEQDLITATARRDRLRATLKEYEILLERSVIRSPIAGVAVDREIAEGEVAAPGTRLTTVQQIDRLLATASVPDTEIGWLGKGSEGTVRLDAWPGRVFPAKVVYVSPSADTNTRTFEVELELSNRDGELRPGMVARVSLRQQRLSDAVTIPLDALIARVDGRVAFVVEDCRAVMRRIEIGPIEADRALVEAGLELGEELVVSGQQDLADGQPVRTEVCR